MDEAVNKRKTIIRAIDELDALLAAYPGELQFDWNGYVGEARAALDAALSSLQKDDAPTDRLTKP